MSINSPSLQFVLCSLAVNIQQRERLTFQFCETKQSAPTANNSVSHWSVFSESKIQEVRHFYLSHAKMEVKCT